MTKEKFRQVIATSKFKSIRLECNIHYLITLTMMNEFLDSSVHILTEIYIFLGLEDVAQ